MTPPDREAALETLRARRRAAAPALRPPLARTTPSGGRTIGGGDWSAKDLLGHMALWEELALATIDPWLRDERPRLEERFFDGDVDALNAWNEERKRDWPLERIRTEADEMHAQLLGAIERLGPDGWTHPRGFEDDRARRATSAPSSGASSARRTGRSGTRSRTCRTCRPTSRRSAANALGRGASSIGGRGDCRKSKSASRSPSPGVSSATNGLLSGRPSFDGSIRCPARKSSSMKRR